MQRPNVNVYITAYQFSKTETDFIASVLNDHRGYGKIARFTVIVDPSIHFFNMPKHNSIVVYGNLDSKAIKRALPNEKSIHNMSFTYLYEVPPIIVFNKDNWNGPPENYKKSFKNPISHRLLLRQYRIYLINHEFGHAMSLLHEKSNEQLCPLMYQHTRGVGHCQNKQIWPSQQNLAQIQNRFLKNN